MDCHVRNLFLKSACVHACVGTDSGAASGTDSGTDSGAATLDCRVQNE
jgi:hypothetical protein